MKSRSLRILAGALVATAAMSMSTWGGAGDPGLTDEAEFSLVATNGNAESVSLGLRNTLWYGWERSLFTFDAGAVRVETESGDTVGFDSDASVTPGDPFSVIDPDLETSTENYYLRLRYDREITERFFWFALAGWDRNRPAGINNRLTGGAGVGNIWKNTDKVKFRTDYGLTYTDQENIVPPDTDFVGARLSWAYSNKLTSSTKFVSDLIIDLNLDETDDARADFTNGVQVAINSSIALKISLQLLYDNMPSFETVPVFDGPGGTGTLLRTEPNELDELDSILRSSIVVNF